MNVGVFTSKVEAAPRLVPTDLEVFGGDRGSFDAFSPHGRDEVRHVVEVLSVESDGEQSEGLAYALLVAEREMRSPLVASGDRFWFEAVVTSWLAQEREVGGQAAPEAGRVAAHRAVVPQVSQKPVRERLR